MSISHFIWNVFIYFWRILGRITIIFFKMIFYAVLTKWVHEDFIEKLVVTSIFALSHCFKSNFDSMQTLIDIIEFTPLVNFLRNDNSRCCCIKDTKTESVHQERRIYGSCPAGRDTANAGSTDLGRNVDFFFVTNL